MGKPEDSASYNHHHTAVLDLGWERFGQLCKQLVENVTRDYQPEVVVGIAKGGVLPGVVISSALFINFFPIKLSSREDEKIVRETPEFFVPPTSHLKNKKVLLVDDICVTMRTLDIARNAIEDVGAAEVRCATFAVHKFSQKPEWYALNTDDLILNPWDKEIFADGRWKLNPEYEEEIGEMGLERHQSGGGIA